MCHIGPIRAGKFLKITGNFSCNITKIMIVFYRIMKFRRKIYTNNIKRKKLFDCIEQVLQLRDKTEKFFYDWNPTMTVMSIFNKKHFYCFLYLFRFNLMIDSSKYPIEKFMISDYNQFAHPKIMKIFNDGNNWRSLIAL